VIELFSAIQPFLLKAAVYILVNLALLVALVAGVARHYSLPFSRTWYWYLLCLGFAPTLELLHIGQINLITLAGIALLFLWQDRDPPRGARSIVSGLGLGLAVVTQVTPLFFLGYLVALRQFKTAAITLAVIALLFALSAYRYGATPIQAYPEALHWLLGQHPLDTNSQSLAAKLAVADLPRFQHALALLPQPLAQPIHSLATFLSVNFRAVQTALTLTILLTLAASGLFTLLGRQPKEPLFIITSLGMMLIPNVMWYHHYVFILLPLLVWMGWQRLDWRVVTWCLSGLLTIQFDRWFTTYGLLIHAFGHASLLALLAWQARDFLHTRRRVISGSTAVSRPER
jgi:hypothetical protein